MDVLRSAPRILELGCSGADVALLQRDLNVWYGMWGAPGRAMLDEDGDLGCKTDLAFRRVARRLGLRPARVAGRAQITARDRLLVRHLGRLLRARAEGRDYTM